MPPIPLDPEKEAFIPCSYRPSEEDQSHEPVYTEAYLCTFDPPSESENRHMEALIRKERRRYRAFQSGLVLMILGGCWLLFNFSQFIPPCHMPSMKIASLWRESPTSQSPPFPTVASPKRIPLEAHIMSKCPDARDCLRDLVVPAMEKISDKVDFRLSFIGKTIPNEDGVSCLHGPTECLGNLLELCAAKLYPPPKTYLGFTLCLSLSYPEIPSRDLVESCALESGIDAARLEACTAGQDDDDDDDDDEKWRDDGDDDDDGDGHMAWGLLKKSFQRSADANVTRSCTVRLDGEIRCIRDGGKWTDCEGGHEVGDLTGDVERLFRERNHGGGVVAKEDV